MLRAGADDGQLADADGGKVQPATRAGGVLRGVPRVLPRLPLRPQALLADQHGERWCAALCAYSFCARLGPGTWEKKQGDSTQVIELSSSGPCKCMLLLHQVNYANGPSRVKGLV